MTDDPQMDLLHNVELEFGLKRKRCVDYNGHISLKKARKLIAGVRKLYGLPPITLVSTGESHARFAAWAQTFRDDDGAVTSARITVTKANPVTAKLVLHELAHIVTDHFFGRQIQNHGREFAGVMAHLFDHFQVIPFVSLRPLYCKHGIEYRHPRFCTPAALKGRG
jgi:hypothetical protein